ncbi:doublesex- and mab-3-related transcription factor C2-like [Bos indicus]|uniref:Doublesex- and mab-3-related transcription factor C2-like n=1 Tax=Bos indicus TaxID=9915 RepID=A0ABM4S031_BOSIN
MDPNEMPGMPSCLPDSTPGLETGAPRGIELGPRGSIRRCARCHNHGITDQIKDEEHLCLFQACKCHKCVLSSEHDSILPAERDLKTDQGPHLRRRPTRGRIRGGTTSPRARSRGKKSGTQARVPDNLRRRSAARSSPGLFVSVLDSSTLEEATNNFSFEGVAQIPCPAQQASRVRKTMGLLVYCVTECPNLLLKALELEGGDGGSTGQLGAGGEVEEGEEEQASQT